MTQVLGDKGVAEQVTVIKAEPCVVMQVKTLDIDGYHAVQLGYQEQKPHRSTKPMIGHAAKAGTGPKRFLREVRLTGPAEVARGDVELANREKLLSQPRAWFQHVRIYWLVHSLVGRRGNTTASDLSQSPLRVDLDDYRANLESMAAAAAEHDCTIVFVTAPTSLTQGALPQSMYIDFQLFYQMTEAEIDDIPRVHAAHEHCNGSDIENENQTNKAGEMQEALHGLSFRYGSGENPPSGQ